MIDKDTAVRMSFLKANLDIVRVKVQSRHKNSKTYNCYVHYRPNTSGRAGILHARYCCDCANGNRTIGCCAHVADVIYYLSHGRFLNREFNPAGVLSELFTMEETIPVICDESEEDDDDEYDVDNNDNYDY